MYNDNYKNCKNFFGKHSQFTCHLDLFFFCLKYMYITTTIKTVKTFLENRTF